MIGNMTATTLQERRRQATMDRQSLSRHQLERLTRLLETILPENAFYAEKFAEVSLPLSSLDDLARVPFTYKDELVSAQEEGHTAANRTFPLDAYVHFHQTSGTHGRPMSVLDTADDWQWWIDCWQHVLDAAEIGPDDRCLMAFSFGPFIGFWSAHDAAAARGCLVVPGGGMNTLARLQLMRTTGTTAIFCTPSYALHMADVAAEHQIDTASLDVRRIVVAGEPGGSIPAVRERIEQRWNAKLIDHSGATEVGPWGYGDAQERGLHVLESEFIAEFLSVDSGEAATEGELSELVITALGREGSPIIRYRTGDLVRPVWDHDQPDRFVLLDGGVLGRADDMMIIRGMNIYPSSVEQILRTFPEVVEFRMTAQKEAELDRLTIEIEDRLDQPERVAEELRLRLGLKIEVRTVPLGSLPRFEAKGRRFVDQR
jgi:phenylacetate-CoA ligase